MGMGENIPGCFPEDGDEAACAVICGKVDESDPVEGPTMGPCPFEEVQSTDAADKYEDGEVEKAVHDPFQAFFNDPHEAERHDDQ